MLPVEAGKRLQAVRDLIFTVASELPETGGLVEYLVWGQPSYRPVRERVGTSVRLGIHPDERAAMLVHCATSLIAEFRAMFDHLEFETRRAVLLPATGHLPVAELEAMIELALTSKRRVGRLNR